MRWMLGVLVGLAVVAQALAWDRVLTWDPNDLGEWVTSYRVYVIPSDGQPPQEIGRVTVNPPEALGQTRFDLRARTGVECYAVSAVNGVGESAMSEVVCGPRPTAPTNPAVVMP